MRNNEFNSNAAIYYLLEHKMAANSVTNAGDQLRKSNLFNSYSRNHLNQFENSGKCSINMNSENSTHEYNLNIQNSSE